MMACLASPDGFVTKESIEFYKSFARGGAGIVTIGDAAIDFEYTRGHFTQLNVGDNKGVGGLSTLAEAIRRYVAKISIDLSEIIGNVPIDKKSLIRAISHNESRVRKVLDNYPFYFTERLEYLL